MGHMFETWIGAAWLIFGCFMLGFLTSEWLHRKGKRNQAKTATPQATAIGCMTGLPNNEALQEMLRQGKQDDNFTGSVEQYGSIDVLQDVTIALQVAARKAGVRITLQQEDLGSNFGVSSFRLEGKVSQLISFDHHVNLYLSHIRSRIPGKSKD